MMTPSIGNENINFANMAHSPFPIQSPPTNDEDNGATHTTSHAAVPHKDTPCGTPDTTTPLGRKGSGHTMMMHGASPYTPAVIPSFPLSAGSLEPFKNAVAGHHLMFRCGSTIVKEATEREESFYYHLRRLAYKERKEVALAIMPYIADFSGIGELSVDDLRQLYQTLQMSASTSEVFSARMKELHDPTTKPQRFILLRDVTDGFEKPCVLDVKMGVRGYGLNAPLAKKKSKSRKSLNTTSSTMGIRISGMRLCDRRSSKTTHYNKVQGRELTTESMLGFVRVFFLNEVGAVDTLLVKRFMELLQGLEDVFQCQELFHFFTSSLLLTYDAADPVNTAAVTMVDFAHTYTVPEILRSEPQNTPRDEGYLAGLQNLVKTLQGVLDGVELVDGIFPPRMPSFSSLSQTPPELNV
jgi:hypothetical protein